jgi:hypothetical protein
MGIYSRTELPPEPEGYKVTRPLRDTLIETEKFFQAVNESRVHLRNTLTNQGWDIQIVIDPVDNAKVQTYCGT